MLQAESNGNGRAEDRSFLIGLGSVLNPEEIDQSETLDQLEKEFTECSNVIISAPQKSEIDQIIEEINRISQESPRVSRQSSRAASPVPAFTSIFSAEGGREQSEAFAGRVHDAEAFSSRARDAEAFAGRFHGAEHVDTLERDTHEKIDALARDMFPTNSIDANATTMLDEERREEDRVFMIDEIANMAQELANLGHDVSPYQNLENEPYEKILRLRTRIRNRLDSEYLSSISGEFILNGAKLIEKLFDGKRVWFGKFNPDLTGWSRTLTVRVRRLRPQVSRNMSNLFNGYDNPLLLNMAFELIPSAFAYSSNLKEKQKQQRDSVV